MIELIVFGWVALWWGLCFVICKNGAKRKAYLNGIESWNEAEWQAKRFNS